MRKTLTDKDLEFYVLGSTVLSTGGGGIVPSEERFHTYVERLREGEKSPILVDASDLPPGCFVFEHMGVGGGIQAEIRRKYPLAPGSDPYYERWVKGFNTQEWISKMIDLHSESFPLCHWSQKPNELKDFTLDSYFSDITGMKPYAYILSEIGPNGFYEIINSADKGIPIVDGDLAGYRAVPEISLSTLNIYEINPGTVVFLSAWGDLVRVERTLNYQRLEDIARHLAISSGGAISGVHAISSSDLKRALVPSSISKAIEIGKFVLSYQKNSCGIVDIARAAGGSIIFEGKVDMFIRETKDSFHFGDIFIAGIGDHLGKELRIWFKNENHITWLNGTPYVCSPDLISVVDKNTGVGIPNANEREWYSGREVCVLGIPAYDAWYTLRGLKIFNPKHFGFDISFKPLRDLVSK
jgi:DUF917 family protein